MNDERSGLCPDCSVTNETGLRDARRAFLRTMGGGAAALVAAGPLVRRAVAEEKAAAKPAEGLIRELYGTLTEEQRREVVLPWDHGASGGTPTRLGMYNSPISGKRIAQSYDKAQQELVQRIFKAILSGEEAYERISRGGKWDGAGSFQGIGCMLFGNPTDGKFAAVFSGHHLTVRCDGNSEPNAAFGGPMYYGHSANGHSEQNVYNFQTKRVQAVYAMLDGKQREKAVAKGNPGEQAGSVKFRKAGEAHPGIGYADLSADQRALVEAVMRDLLSPFRKEDADEVMQIVKQNGGMEKLSLAFYADDAEAQKNERWHFWRLEGPGFVWNFRVLPHVHCFVNIAGQA